MKIAFAAFAAVMAQATTAATPPVAAPPSEEIAPGVHLLRGAMLPERGPDGNSVVFEAPQGLVVIDTGRHNWHSDAILALAAARNRPVAAIINTHWHLDHSSGNARIKAAHPGAQLYTTNAIDRALSDGGFLVRNLDSARPMLDDPKLGELRREEVQIFITTMDERESLRPDIVIEWSGRTTIAGRDFDLRVTDRAVTDADVWLYDEASGVAVLGDLVTLPAPFFETACPAQWRVALDDVSAVPYRSAIPGHGEPMNRAQFDAYRGAFNSYMDCVGSDSAPTQCATVWADAVAPLIGEDERRLKTSLEYAEYYAGMLRKNGGRSADCLER